MRMRQSNEMKALGETAGMQLHGRARNSSEPRGLVIHFQIMARGSYVESLLEE